MMVTALGSVTGPVARAGMYTYLPALPTPHCFCPRQAPRLVAAPHPVTSSFTPWRPVLLPGLGCCDFPLTLIPGPGNPKRRPKGCPVSQTCSSMPHCGAVVPCPIGGQDRSPSQHLTPFLPIGRHEEPSVAG